MKKERRFSPWYLVAAFLIFLAVVWALSGGWLSPFARREILKAIQ